MRYHFDFANELLRDLERAWEIRPYVSHNQLSHIREDEKAYYLSLDLPGVEKDNIYLTNEEGLLRMEASRKVYEEEKTFSRTFQLPDDVNGEEIRAQLRSGVLEILLPKAEKTKAKPIPVLESQEPFFLEKKEEKKEENSGCAC